ncbi:YciI family protein [Rhodococcus erythropolis]|uniref:YciI family protein n=1 Tax=Rhodococcus erythropolis TaxID=1833 RepID=UPI0037FC6AFA
MIVAHSTYTRSLADEDKGLITRHLAFVKQGFDDGTFVAAGPRPSSIGGVVVTRGLSEDELRTLMRQDPFVRAGLVDEYEMLPFHVSMASFDDLDE